MSGTSDMSDEELCAAAGHPVDWPTNWVPVDEDMVTCYCGASVFDLTDLAADLLAAPTEETT